MSDHHRPPAYPPVRTITSMPMEKAEPFSLDGRRVPSRTPVTRRIGEHEGESATALGALVSTLTGISAGEAPTLVPVARAQAEDDGLRWAEVVAEYRRAMADLGQAPVIEEEVEVVGACPHDEVEFSEAEGSDEGALIIHVRCSTCGCRGSATIRTVLWQSTQDTP